MCHKRQIHSLGTRALVKWSNYNYSKLRKEEVIYKGLVCTNTRVLPLHTAYASRASARDHVTWNASPRTVTLPPPFRKSLSSSFVVRNRIIEFCKSLCNSFLKKIVAVL